MKYVCKYVRNSILHIYIKILHWVNRFRQKSTRIYVQYILMDIWSL